MKNMARHIVTGTLTLLVLWAASCSHDTEVFGTSDKEPILSIGLRLPARSPEPGEGYEAGETYENRERTGLATANALIDVFEGREPPNRRA